MRKLSIVCLFLSLSAFAQELSSEEKHEIDTYLQGKVSTETPGIAVGIVRDGQVVFEHYGGLANLQNGVAIDEKSKFNIASVAKQFTALAVLQLSKEGKLSLEDDVRTYFPGFFPETKEPILVGHLLNHTSGIRDYSDLLSIRRTPWWRQVGYDNSDVIEELLGRQQDVGFRPGSIHVYSNSNYTLLTKIVEMASGKSFHDYTREMFDQLGMRSTTFNRNYMAVIPDMAFPYADWGDGVWQQYPMLTNLYGDGFLFTTLRDQLTYEIALQSPEVAKWLSTSQEPIEFSEIKSYGFGLELTERMNYPAVHHSGSTGAYHAQTVRFPSERLAIVVMSNNSTLWSGYIADKITSILLEKRAREEVKLPKATGKRLTQSDLVGEYQSSKGKIIRIRVKDGELVWRNANNNPLQLNEIDKNTYAYDRYPSSKIRFSDSGLWKYEDANSQFWSKLPVFDRSKNYLNALIGEYENEELDVRFSIDLSDDFQPVIKLTGDREARELEIIQRDAFLVSDYQLTPNYNEAGQVEAMLLTFNRISNMKFRKTNQEVSSKRKFTKDGGYVQVGTTSENYSKKKGGILLTKNLPNGNEEWSIEFDGNSYDIASSVELTEDGGYLITGSTSSYGKGNYDIWIIKTDGKGNKIWDRTFGGELNDYGLFSRYMDDGSILVMGTKQTCKDDQFQDCQTENWNFTFDLEEQ